MNQNLNLDGSVLSQRTASWTNKLESRFGYTPSFDAPNNANLDNQGRLVSKVDGLSNEVNWDLGGVKLTSVSAWRRLYFRPYNDSDNSPYDIYRGGYDVDVNQYSQEFRLASNGTHAIDWQVGTYYLHEDLRSNLRTIYGSDASTFFLGSGTDSAILNDVEYDRDGHLHIDSIAGFGQLTWHVTSKLSLTGGLRYSYEKKSVNVAGYQAAGADVSGASLTSRNAFLASLGGTTAAQAGAYDLSAESDRGSFSWLVNPAWQVNENVLLYASASHGEKSGAANTSATYAQANVILTKPEKSTDFEGGIKTTWANGRVTANLNFYNDTITDYQSNRIDTSNPSFGTYLANVGKVRMRGFEFEASARPIPVLSINLNTSYNDAKYLSYDDAPAPLEYQAALGGSSATLSLTGYQVIGAPKWTVQGGLDLDQPLSDHLSLTAYANTSWRSRTAMINPRSIYGWQDNYAVLDAGIGVKAPDGSWSLQAWARNLTNTHYAVSYGSASAAAPVTEVLGNPRTYGVTFSHRF
ncbi:TonB-dependent receptor [Novosphingobium sp. 9]|uniref:TonB-dependent receptor n=1 Tax=Novosphingobium sp. 9 TaxID=2025349 RepID=UPI0021B58850|nr:TonB-dependent receptor [Novosphingobium sp. 9]